jgi:uncharacterized protein
VQRSVLGLTFWDVLLLLTILLAHGYLWWRLVRDTTRPRRWRRRLTVLLVALALLVAVAYVVPYPPTPLVALQWIGFSWLGVAVYIVLGLLVLEPIRVGARLWQRARRCADVPARPVAEAATVPASADRSTAPQERESPAA